MNLNKKSNLGILFVFFFSSMILSGCVRYTFTAYDRLFDKISMKSNHPVKSIYLEFSEPTMTKEVSLHWQGYKEQYWGNFENHLKHKLESKGYKLVSSSSDADLVAKFNIHYYI